MGAGGTGSRQRYIDKKIWCNSKHFGLGKLDKFRIGIFKSGEKEKLQKF